jgi:catechol 2,3-dioxygenase-like lactoylglutathione lyase family enzyme
MGIVGLHHVQVNVPASGEEEAKRFYGGLLGLEEMARPESLSEAGRAGAWYRCGENELHLYFNPEMAEERETSSRHPAFLVDDLSALKSRLAAAGAELEEAIPIGGRERFFVRDPFGNRIELMAFA